MRRMVAARAPCSRHRHRARPCRRDSAEYRRAGTAAGCAAHGMATSTRAARTRAICRIATRTATRARRTCARPGPCRRDSAAATSCGTRRTRRRGTCASTSGPGTREPCRTRRRNSTRRRIERPAARRRHSSTWQTPSSCTAGTAPGGRGAGRRVRIRASAHTSRRSFLGTANRPRRASTCRKSTLPPSRRPKRSPSGSWDRTRRRRRPWPWPVPTD